jgi:hypothetical protein
LSSGAAFAKGDRVLFSGLLDKPVLNGTIGEVVSFDTASGRYAVNTSSGALRVKEANIRKSIF